MPNNFEVDTNEYLSQCSIKDVISFNNDKWVDIKKIKDIFSKSFYSSGINSIITHMAAKSDLKNTNKLYSWFFDGEECEILKAGSDGWKKGKLKVKVTLEFIPDEPEKNQSPLDDVRQQIDSGDI